MANASALPVGLPSGRSTARHERGPLPLPASALALCSRSASGELLSLGRGPAILPSPFLPLPCRPHVPTHQRDLTAPSDYHRPTRDVQLQASQSAWHYGHTALLCCRALPRIPPQANEGLAAKSSSSFPSCPLLRTPASPLASLQSAVCWHIHTCVHTRTQIHAHAYTRVPVHMPMSTHIRIHKYTCVHVSTRTTRSYHSACKSSVRQNTMTAALLRNDCFTILV